MPKSARKPVIRVKVFVEGLTEKNYIEGFKKSVGNKGVIVEEPMLMGGGGYSNFLSKLRRKRVLAGYSAVFVVVDYDKACEKQTELRQFNEIVKWCKQINKSSSIPYFLIITNPKIEYFACLHFPHYQSQPCDSFILNNTKYSNLDDFKSDPQVYCKLNQNTKSYENACSRLKGINIDQRVLYNVYECKKKGLDLIIKVSDTIHNHDNYHIKSSNFYEFFDIVLKQF